MVNPAESTSLVGTSDDLAHAHEVLVLIHALLMRLADDGRNSLANLIRSSARREATGPSLHSTRLAPILLARLRTDGHPDLADAIASLLSGAAVYCEPMLQIEHTHGSVQLRLALTRRLHVDGRRDLADAIDAASWADEVRERPELDTPPTAPSTIGEREPPAELVAPWALGDALVPLYTADVLARAAVVKLRADGRDILAGAIMGHWVYDVTGPIVDPGPLARAYVETLRAEHRDELAKTIASLLSGEAIDRDPAEIMTTWLREVSGPIIAPGPLFVALIAALDNEGRSDVSRALTRTAGSREEIDMTPANLK